MRNYKYKQAYKAEIKDMVMDAYHRSNDIMLHGRVCVCVSVAH